MAANAGPARAAGSTADEMMTVAASRAPGWLPLSIGDGILAETADSVVSP